MHDHPADQTNDCTDITCVSGDQICSRCEKPYRKHPLEQQCKGWQGPYLRRLCDGRLAKL